MAAAFRTSRRVEFGDTDMAGIAHFSNFFRWMEAAETAFLREHGLSVVLHSEEEHVSFPRVAASCDYLAPVRFEDLLEVTVSVRRLGRSSITYGFEFSKGGQAVARGQVTCVCCRVGEGQPMRAHDIPAAVRAVLAAHAES